VDENQLSGTIESSSPDSFSSSPIRVLRYGKQGFYGSLPTGYEGFPNLQDLYAQHPPPKALPPSSDALDSMTSKEGSLKDGET